jgi:hypothetical protein
MPSFFESMKRIVQGKPIYNPSDVTQFPQAAQTPQQLQTPQQQMAQLSHEAPQMTRFGPKVLPRVYIEQQCICQVQGSRLECFAYIRNESPVTIEVDKAHILGAKRELDTRLRPGEKRQFLLYSGSCLQNTGQHYAELQYKDETGDYFVSQHTIEFQKQPDNTYFPWRIRYERIKDIE